MTEGIRRSAFDINNRKPNRQSLSQLRRQLPLHKGAAWSVFSLYTREPWWVGCIRNAELFRARYRADTVSPLSCLRYVVEVYGQAKRRDDGVLRRRYAFCPNKTTEQKLLPGDII